MGRYFDDIPHSAINDVLRARAAYFVDVGLAESSRLAQRRHVLRFTQFADVVHMNPFPASESLLCIWVAHLSQSARAASIKCYLASVRSEHVDRGLLWNGQSLRLNRLLRGIQRSQCNVVTKAARLAITADIVRKLSNCLSSSHNELMLKAAMWCAVTGLFRIGEVAPLSASSERLLLLSDLSWSPLSKDLAIRLRRSKTDIFGRSVSVRIPSQDAVHAMAEYLTSLRKHVAFEDGTPMFCTQNATPLLRRAFIDSLSMLLRRVEINPSEFRALSFRAGGASSLAAAGAPIQTIMSQGRWRSSAVMRYIDVQPPDASLYS